MDPSTPPVNGRRDDELHLREVWDLLVRNRLLIAALFLVVFGTGVAYTMRSVPVYEARTTIRIEEDRSNVPVLDILQSLSQGSQVETEMEVLRSRTIAEDVVTGLGLQLVLERPRGRSRAGFLRDVYVERWAPQAEYRIHRGAEGRFHITDANSGVEHGSFGVGEAVALPGVAFTLTEAAEREGSLRIQVLRFEEALRQLGAARSVVRPNREANVVAVRYESSDTQLVHDVPNLIAARFIERRRDVQKTGARSAVVFLQEQIDSLAIELAEAEDQLQAYREGQQVVSLEAEKTAQVTQLARIQAERNQLDAERAALRRLLDEIEAEERRNPTSNPPSPYRRIIAFPSLLPIPAVSELLRSLNDAETPLSELLNRRTREDPDVINLTRRIQEIEEQLRNIAVTYLEGLTNQVWELDRTLAQFGRDLERIPARELATARLERQASVVEEIYTLLQSRLKEAEIAEALEDASVMVIDPAVLPSRPIRPRRMLNFLLAGVLGMMLGVGVAFGREFLDDTVHTREDLEGATGGAPVIGIIPRIRGGSSVNGRGKGKGKHPAGSPMENGVGALEARLVTGRDPRSPVSEAYRGLRTNITFSNPDRPPKSLVFTSPLPQDGKSTTASNLAITLTQQGLRVILVDGDLRRGVLNTVFRVTREPGLSNVLAGQNTLAEAIRRVELGESGVLRFLPTGALPPNPSELLGSERMSTLLRSLEESFDIVIIDCAPLGVVTDAAILGTKVDGVLLVARASTTEKGALAFATDQLRRVRAPILGTVLNDVDYRRDSRYSSAYGRYGYHYQYYYGEKDPKAAKG